MTACTPIRSQMLIGSFDLLDPASPVFLNPGFDRGAAEPTLSSIQSSILDGAAVTGRASGNRSPSIPVTIKASSRKAVATLVNQLTAVVTQSTWQIQFTPAGGLTVLIDCFRAKVTVVSPLAQDELTASQSLLITCAALPYARSPQAVTVPLIGNDQSLDAFDAGPAPSSTLVYPPTAAQIGYVTSPRHSGSGSLALTSLTWCRQATPSGGCVNGYSAFGIYLTRTGLSMALTSDKPTMSIQIQSGPSSYSPEWYVMLQVTTSDGVQHTSTFPSAYAPNKRWTRITGAFDTPLLSGTTVTGWRLTVVGLAPNGAVSSTTQLPTAVYLDTLNLNSASSSSASDPQGSVFQLTGVVGAARTPISVHVARVTSGATFRSLCVHAPPADRPTAQPLLPMGNVKLSDHPSYTTDPSVRYDGTYSVYVFYGSVAMSGSKKALSFYATDGTDLVVAPAPASITPFSNGMYYLGDLVLPPRGRPAESLAALTFGFIYYGAFGDVQDSANDYIQTVLLLDTRGQTVISVGVPEIANAWLDQPDPETQFGGVWRGTAVDRSDAVSVGSDLKVGGVLLADPGDSALLIASPQGALAAEVTYYPRWLQEADQ